MPKSSQNHKTYEWAQTFILYVYLLIQIYHNSIICSILDQFFNVELILKRILLSKSNQNNKKQFFCKKSVYSKQTFGNKMAYTNFFIVYILIFFIVTLKHNNWFEITQDKLILWQNKCSKCPKSQNTLSF